MLALKSTRLSQPQGRVEIDWSNPLTIGLNSVYLPGIVLGKSKIRPVVFGPLSKDRPGCFCQFNGSSNNVNLLSSELSHGTGSRFALIKVGAANASRVVSAGGTGSTGLRINVNSIEIINPGVAINLTSSPILVSGYLAAVGISYAPSDLEIYLNGSSVASNSASTGSTNNNTNVIGQNGSGSQYFDGGIFCHYSFSRRLTTIQHASLAANPWQIFR